MRMPPITSLVVFGLAVVVAAAPAYAAPARSTSVPLPTSSVPNSALEEGGVEAGAVDDTDDVDDTEDSLRESTEPTAEVEASSAGTVVIHVLNERPDPDRGFVKLARYESMASMDAAGGSVTITQYSEICTVPCDVEIDTSDRPLFFFIRDERAVSYTFRLPSEGEHTVRVRPPRRGLVAGGVILTYMALLPAGVPMWVSGQPRVTVAMGPPEPGQHFRRVKRVRW